MICPLCKSELESKNHDNGWFAECKNKNCRLSVGKKDMTLRQFGSDFYIRYSGLFRTEKALKKYVNQGVIK